MQIRRSLFWLAAGSCAMLALVIWLMRRPAAPPLPSEPNNQAEDRGNLPLHQSKLWKDQRPQTNHPQQAVNRAQQPPVSSDEQFRQAMTQNDVPIVFFGKLQDQFGNAVTGATVKVNIQVHTATTEGTIRREIISDDAGLFTVSGDTGERLSVVPQKPGYALASMNGGGIYSHLYPDEQRAHPDPNNPVLIKMWKLQGEEPLLTFEQHHKLAHTASPILFDFIDGKIVSSGGDLKITVARPPGELSLRNRQEWSVTVEAIDGGIMPSSGLESFTYWAPESGYQPNRTIVMSTNAPNKWFDGFTEGFFVVSRNRRVYTKLGLSVRINQHPDGIMYITVAGIANTNGSRNWEGDPNTYKVFGK